MSFDYLLDPPDEEPHYVLRPERDEEDDDRDEAKEWGGLDTP